MSDLGLLSGVSSVVIVHLETDMCPGPRGLVRAMVSPFKMTREDPDVLRLGTCGHSPIPLSYSFSSCRRCSSSSMCSIVFGRPGLRSAMSSCIRASCLAMYTSTTAFSEARLSGEPESSVNMKKVGRWTECQLS